MRETGLCVQNPEGSFTYRAAALIIQGGRLLVAKNVEHPLYYTVGGVVEINETSEEAVVREVYEETGCRLAVDRLAYVQERFFRAGGQALHEVVFFYLMKENPAMEIAENSFTDQETETLHWLPLDRLREYDLVPAFLKTKALGEGDGIEHIISRE